MFKELEGYVIYCKDSNKSKPFGVVSNTYECKASAYYIPEKIKKFLVEIEDRRFYTHHGVDIKGILRAVVENIRHLRIIQGGSTISQQLARNLLRDNRRCLSRKIKEIIKAIKLERSNSKNEILNLYFDNVYFGKNIWGIRSASLSYFGKEVQFLTQSELLYLLTILRGPNYYIKNSEAAIKRFKVLNSLLFQREYISENRFTKNLKIPLKPQGIKLYNINKNTLPFITQKVDTKSKKILSTLDIQIQNGIARFISDSKYPVSIIAIKQGQVVGVGSSYGTDYPFSSKANVGSTLKPFIYCYLRDKGILRKEQFNSNQNDMSWNVREVDYYKPQLTIEEALFHSNNNAFLNAVNKIGLKETLHFLADLFKKPHSSFFPSSILGALQCGLSLHELAHTYWDFFNREITDSKKECKIILGKIFYEKIGIEIEGAFLKTGTTNNNKERYAVLGNPDITYAILRNENEVTDYSKEGGFMDQIARSIFFLFKPKTNFKWI